MGEVRLSSCDDVGVITIDSPRRLNAFTRTMRSQIPGFLASIETDSRLVGAVLTGAGDAFCAGQDLDEAATWTADTPWVEEFEELFRAILRFPKPLVAAVNGVAAGGGFQVALICDYRVAHAGVRMGQTEVKRGLASVTGTWLLQRSVGAARAREFVLGGRLMLADELLRLGLVDSIVPREQVMSTALSACRNLAESPADSFARTKEWLYESISEELSAVFKDACRVHRRGFTSGVSQGGAKKFVARRQHVPEQ